MSDFKPVFLTVRVISKLTGQSWPLNPEWFADDVTAEFLRDKYHAFRVEAQPLYGGGLGNLYVADPIDAHENVLVFRNPDGTEQRVIAGWLASTYNRWDEFTAEKLNFKFLIDIGVRFVG
jgi:hypothetical protein